MRLSHQHTVPSPNHKTIPPFSASQSLFTPFPNPPGYFPFLEVCVGGDFVFLLLTEMTCRRVNKIHDIRPFSLFNKRASYRPVL